MRGRILFPVGFKKPRFDAETAAAHHTLTGHTHRPQLPDSVTSWTLSLSLLLPVRCVRVSCVPVLCPCLSVCLLDLQDASQKVR